MMKSSGDLGTYTDARYASVGDAPIGIYIHVPFCNGKCPYCDFYSGYGTAAEMDEYCNALCRCIDEWGALLGRRAVDSVYFGGGTPSLFGGEHISAVMSAIRTGFLLTDDCSITVEVNPRSSDEGLFALLAAAGCNRVSIGAQSMVDAELAFLHRRHLSSSVAVTAEAARRAGILDISLDLMLNLPPQTAASIDESISRMVALAPTHISAYMLKLEPGTPFSRLSPIDEDEAARQYLQVCDSLKQNGYAQYEISNFARDGHISRHNMKYWTLDEYLGIGAGAHGYLGGNRYFYPPSTPAFISGCAPKYESVGGTKEEQIMLGLRLTRGIPLALLGDRANTAMRYVRAGLMRCDGDNIAFTPRGFLVSNSVISELI